MIRSTFGTSLISNPTTNSKRKRANLKIGESPVPHLQCQNLKNVEFSNRREFCSSSTGSNLERNWRILRYPDGVQAAWPDANAEYETLRYPNGVRAAWPDANAEDDYEHENIFWFTHRSLPKGLPTRPLQPLSEHRPDLACRNGGQLLWLTPPHPGALPAPGDASFCVCNPWAATLPPTARSRRCRQGASPNARAGLP